MGRRGALTAAYSLSPSLFTTPMCGMRIGNTLATMLVVIAVTPAAAQQRDTQEALRHQRGQQAPAPGGPQSAKPPIRGLVSMGAFKFVGSGGDPDNTLEPLNAKPGIFGGLVVVSTWRQMQPVPNGEIPADNPVDKAMAEVRAYNARNPQKPLAVRLRIWAGFEAPLWAMEQGGPPIAAVHNNKHRQVGRFWSPAYRKAWRDFQDKLAAKYDGFPLIREVAMTSCMSFTAEPFFSTSEDSVQMPIREAGFNEDDYRQCLRNGIADYAACKRTRIVLSVNPLRTALNQGQGDAAFTEQVMRDCRKTLAVRCVLDNHDLSTQLAKPLIPIYALMKQLGPEIAFQTANETPPDFEGTIRMGISYGATAIELWQDYKGFPLVPDATLRRWAAMIEANKGR